MDEGPWFVPGSTVNELRREALDALLQKREVLRPWPVQDVELEPLPQRTCRPTGPSVPGSSAGIRCRNRP